MNILVHTNIEIGSSIIYFRLFFRRRNLTFFRHIVIKLKILDMKTIFQIADAIQLLFTR